MAFILQMFVQGYSTEFVPSNYTPPGDLKEKDSEARIKIRSPKGNWQADIDVKLVFATIKPVKCDRENEGNCVRSDFKGDKTIALYSVLPNGDEKILCEGVLIGDDLSPDEGWCKYYFEPNGYINYSN